MFPFNSSIFYGVSCVRRLVLSETICVGSCRLLSTTFLLCPLLQRAFLTSVHILTFAVLLLKASIKQWWLFKSALSRIWALERKTDTESMKSAIHVWIPLFPLSFSTLWKEMRRTKWTLQSLLIAMIYNLLLCTAGFLGTKKGKAIFVTKHDLMSSHSLIGATPVLLALFVTCLYHLTEITRSHLHGRANVWTFILGPSDFRNSEER